MLDPAVLDEAVRLLDAARRRVIDWKPPPFDRFIKPRRSLANAAREYALKTVGCDPDEAWACGLLAPLGWFGVCAADPSAAAACLADPEFVRRPARTQRRHWGLDQAALSRRLACRWRLPEWLRTVIGCLHLPAELARTFRPRPRLLRCVRHAVEQTRKLGLDLGLDGDRYQNLPPATRRTSRARRGECLAIALPFAACCAICSYQAAENRRLREAAHGTFLETRDRSTPSSRWKSRRVRGGRPIAGRQTSALAEFAAGAGHEINNPLAVISGQAQYLLAHANDWFPGDSERPSKALHTIIGQTQRIHGISAQPDAVRTAGRAASCLVRPAVPVGGNGGVPWRTRRSTRRMGIEIGRKPDRLAVFADAEQVRIALTCLLRNAIEAAPGGSWVRVAVVEPVSDMVIEVAVEDGGPGPDAGATARSVRSLLFWPRCRSRPGTWSAGGLAAGAAARRRRSPGRDAAGRPDAIPPFPASNISIGSRSSSLILYAPPRRDIGNR